MIKLDKTKLSRSIATKQKLVPYIERWLDQNPEFSWSFIYEPKVGDDAWHPSGDCTSSLHDLYQKAKGQLEGRPISAQLRRTFMNGHFWHQYLQEVVRRLEFCTPEDIENRHKVFWGDLTPHLVDPAGDNLHAHFLLPQSRTDGPNGAYGRPLPFHWATGSADIAPCALPVHGDYLIDFKTMKESDFKQVRDYNRLPKWCAAKYEAQMAVYLKWFDLEHALIVAVDKNSSEMYEYEMAANPALADAIEAKWKLVSACLAEGVVPPEDEPFPLPLKETS